MGRRVRRIGKLRILVGEEMTVLQQVFLSV